MRARKRFGQNFLTDRNTIDRIIAAIDPKPGERIVEIGPGHGALTEALVESGADLTVIEIDRDLAEDLRARFNGLDLIEADILKFDFASLRGPKPLRIVGNLPYNISTPLLFRLFDYTDDIVDMHFMLQLEVVDRIVAQPSTDDYGRLSIMAQYYCRPEKLFSVAASAFKPKPKVMSSIIRLEPKPDHIAVGDLSILEDMVNRAFSQRRKTIRNGLKYYMSSAEIERVGLDSNLRPENLSLSDFVTCANFVFERNST